MESTPPINPSQETPKSNRNLIIGVVIAVVLCCCCVVTGAAGYYGYQAYITAQQAVQQFEDIQIPEIPSDIPLDPNNLPTGVGEVPTGGLADEGTRSLAWYQIIGYSTDSGCSAPNAQTTTIAVTQQPDSNGEWVEDWNVDCGDGTAKPFKVTFTQANGIVIPIVELP